MTFDFLAMKTTSTMERKAEKERLKEEERAKAQAIEQVRPCLSSSMFLFGYNGGETPSSKLKKEGWMQYFSYYIFFVVCTCAFFL